MKKRLTIILIIVGVIAIISTLALNAFGGKTHTVEFDSKGGSKVASQDVKHGDLLEEPKEPTRKGYSFEGWYTTSKADKNDKYDFEEPVKESFTLYAKWTKVETFTVTFDTGEGSYIEDLIVGADGKVKRPSNPTREGYIFVRWEVNGKPFDFSKPITSDITLVAVWRKVQTEEDRPVTPPTPPTGFSGYTVEFRPISGTKESKIIVKRNCSQVISSYALFVGNIRIDTPYSGGGRKVHNDLIANQSTFAIRIAGIIHTAYMHDDKC